MGPRLKLSAKDLHAVVNVNLSAGDWIDVMDAEGTWNVAQVLEVPTPTMIEVKYDGWGTEYNEVLPLNSERVAPYHTYTWSVKCWAKYKNWPWWPAIVTVRPPGNAAGQRYLENESRLFVDFLDGKDITKRCRCWVERANVKPFSDRHDERRKRTTGTDFEASFAMTLASTAVEKFPSFTKGKGTLPVQYKTQISVPVKTMRKELGMHKWAVAFNTSRPRHCGVYLYKSAGIRLSNVGDEEDDDPVVQFVPLSDEDDDTRKTSRPKARGKASVRIKSEKKITGGKTSCSKPPRELVEQVALITDSTLIIEGPHAPSPEKQPTEQPLSLAPMEDQIGDDGLSASDGETSQSVSPIRLTVSPIQSNKDIAGSRKCRSRESPKSFRVKAQQRFNKDEFVGDTCEAYSDADNERSATPTGEDSAQASFVGTSVTVGGDGAVDGTDDLALIEDIDENDDDDDESDAIPLDALDEVEPTVSFAVTGTPPPYREPWCGWPADELPVLCSGQAESPRVDTVVALSPVPLPITSNLSNPVETNAADARQETPDVSEVDVVEATQANRALANLKDVSDSLAKCLSPTPAIKQAKPPKSNRKSAKSLADERIAQTQAVLAEHGDNPAPTKKRRTARAVLVAATLKSVTSKNPEFNSTKSSEGSTEKKKALTVAVSPTVEQCQPSQDENERESAEGTRDTRRRSSMRAGAKRTEGNGKRKSQGKTPVWALPTPKFDPNPSEGTSPWLAIAKPALPPPFSSLSLFGSAVDFSLSKWFKQDNHYWKALAMIFPMRRLFWWLRCRLKSVSKQDNEGDLRDDCKHRPMYASRHPPLVQPLQISSFTQRTLHKYGTSDLAHEWVALFQMISGTPHDRSATARGVKTSMKMNVPDTIFLSPTGNSSLWYRTSSSKHVKARNLAHVTPQSILDSLLSKQGDECGRCAIVYQGFDTKLLDTKQLQDLALQMEHACIRSPTKHLVNDANDRSDDIPLDEDDSSGLPESVSASHPDRDILSPFCVQAYVRRAQDVSFLCLWRQYTMTLASETSRPDVKTTKVKVVDEVFLAHRRDTLNDPMESSIDLDDSPFDPTSVVLEKLELDKGDDSRTRRRLEDVGFDTDTVVPLLFHMKLLTSEIVTRINRACGSSRQLESLACEFFLSPDHASLTAHTGVGYSVYFSALAGIQWQGHAASWETLRAFDAMSRGIHDAVSTATSSPRRYRVRVNGDAPTQTARARVANSNMSLVLFDELNPRFPSVQSSTVAEKQWKHKTALLPPHVSPRYIHSEIPKVYRDGQFRPLLSPRQSHAVNRLHSTTSGYVRADAPRLPLSKQYAHMEKELWSRQDVERGLQLLSPIQTGKPTAQPCKTSRSPRHSQGLIKDDVR